MTDESMPRGQDWTGEPGEELSPLELDPQLPDEVDLLIRNTLASLDRPQIPEVVAERIAHALAAEPVFGGLRPTNQVPNQQSPSRRRPTRWLIALPGVAAACVIALVVGASLLGQSGAPGSGANVAGAVPINASGMHYKQALLRAQITSQLPRWRSRVANRNAVPASPGATVTTPSSPTPTLMNPLPEKPSDGGPTTLATPTGANSVWPTTSDPNDPNPETPVTESVRQSVTACINSLDKGEPMYVDVATFNYADQTAELQVAVLAVPSDDQFVEVYVVDVACTDADQVHAHIQVASD